MNSVMKLQRSRSCVWLVLALICLVMPGLSATHAQLPIVDPEQALAQLMQQLQITEEQEPAFRAAIVKVDARREGFRAELTQMAGGAGVDMETLMASAERMQKDSEAFLVDVLTLQQMESFRQLNSFAPIAIN